jgi:hypothetical protein
MTSVMALDYIRLAPAAGALCLLVDYAANYRNVLLTENVLFNAIIEVDIPAIF